MSLCNFSSQLCVCPTCTPVIWTPLMLNPKMLHFWAAPWAFPSVALTLLCISLGSPLELPKLDWVMKRVQWVCRDLMQRTHGKVGSNNCLLFPHSNSELTFYICNFDAVSTKSKLKSSSEHGHFGISKTQIFVLWKSENTFSWKKALYSFLCSVFLQFTLQMPKVYV